MFLAVRSYSPLYKKRETNLANKKNLPHVALKNKPEKPTNPPHTVQSELCSHRQIQPFETYLFTQHETQYATGDIPHNPKTTSLIAFKFVELGAHESRSVGSPICWVAEVYKQDPDSLSSGKENDRD